jgi:hypothetical protein
MSTTDTNMAALEQLLNRAQSEHPAITALSEAVTICQTRHAVHAGVNLQLQAARASILLAQPDEAMEFIERAIDIQAQWAGAAER